MKLKQEGRRLKKGPSQMPSSQQADQLSNLGGFFKLRVAERHLQRENILLVETTTDRPFCHEGVVRKNKNRR